MMWLLTLNVIFNAVCAVCVAALAVMVFHDMHAAVTYRSKALKLSAGVFARSGRGSVLARRQNKQAERDEQEDAEFLHALSVRETSDR